MAELVTQACTDLTNEILSEPEVQKHLTGFLQSGTPVTDQKFVLFGFCIVMSTYLSTISRDIARSIKSTAYNQKLDNNQKKERINNKQRQLFLVIFGDFILWVGLIFPLMWNIWHWFLTLPATGFYFEVMRWWILLGITAGFFYMLFLHLLQSFHQLLQSSHPFKAAMHRSCNILHTFNHVLRSFFMPSRNP